jgi:hypothetical protein
MASVTDENGRTISLPIDRELATRISQVVSELVNKCAKTLLRKGVLFLRETALTAIADRTTLRSLNQGLVEKITTWRKKNTRKHCGEARILTVEEIQTIAQEREAKEAEEQRLKERRRALRGKVGFAKLVWKELPVASDVFQ